MLKKSFITCLFLSISPIFAQTQFETMPIVPLTLSDAIQQALEFEQKIASESGKTNIKEVNKELSDVENSSEIEKNEQ